MKEKITESQNITRERKENLITLREGEEEEGCDGN